MGNKKKRATPYMHRVSGHVRNGRKVRPYLRGDEKKAMKMVNPNPKKPKGYTVKLRYSDKPHDVETVKVISTSYMKALDEALEERLDKRKPISVKLIDPSIGEVLNWAGNRALQYGKTATKKVAKGAYNSAKRSLNNRVDDFRAEQLINQAYSSNKGKAILARAKLQKNYPHVWDVMDISPS